MPPTNNTNRHCRHDLLPPSFSPLGLPSLASLAFLATPSSLESLNLPLSLHYFAIPNFNESLVGMTACCSPNEVHVSGEGEFEGCILWCFVPENMVQGQGQAATGQVQGQVQVQWQSPVDQLRSQVEGQIQDKIRNKTAEAVEGAVDKLVGRKLKFPGLGGHGHGGLGSHGHGGHRGHGHGIHEEQGNNGGNQGQNNAEQAMRSCVMAKGSFYSDFNFISPSKVDFVEDNADKVLGLKTPSRSAGSKTTTTTLLGLGVWVLLGVGLLL